MISLVFVFLSFALFALGAAIGSFLNVIIYRSVHNESWMVGRSKCESCSKQIHWYDNIPLVSYVVLNGKCRYCKTPLSLSHPVIEFMTGSLFVWWFWMGSIFFRLTLHPFSVIQPMFWLLVGLSLLIIFFADIRYMIIPDEAVVFLTVITLLLIELPYVLLCDATDRFCLGDFRLGHDFRILLLFVESNERSRYGLWRCQVCRPLWASAWMAERVCRTFFAFVVGAVVGVGLMLTKKKTLGQAVPFGPFLVLATVATLVFGTHVWQWYIHLLR